MLTIKKGDIFTSNCEYLVNPVNAVGIMGAGLAKQFKVRFPDMYYQYQRMCLNKQLSMGNPQFAYNQNPVRNIILFPTKQHYRDESFLIDIAEGLNKLSADIDVIDIQSIAFPMLGCGLGGLKESAVMPLLIDFATNNDKLHIEVYQPLDKQN